MTIFNSECGWEDWVEAFVETVLEHAKIEAAEIYAEDMDEDYIHLRVKGLDTTNGEDIDTKYLLYYLDAVESLHVNLLFFYILYHPEGDYSTVRDYGAFQIAREEGVCHCFPLDD